MDYETPACESSGVVPVFLLRVEVAFADEQQHDDVEVLLAEGLTLLE